MLRLLIFFIATGACAGHDCEWVSKKIILKDDMKIRVINSETVKVTWEMVKATNQLEIEHTSDIEPKTTLTRGILTIKAHDMPDSAISEKSNIALLILASLLVSPSKFKCMLVFLLFFLVYTNALTIICTPSKIHLKIPMLYAQEICVDEVKCMPLLCNLKYYSQSEYSTVSSLNQVLFADKYCDIRKPSKWDQWVSFHFNVNVSTKDFYLLDGDGDGLVNILEYYADMDIFNTSSFIGSIYREIDVKDIGTNPKKSDSDGDLLQDGFESYNNMKPKIKDSATEDSDNDLLSNLEEQIRRTDPLNPDSDGDGVMDGVEVRNKANPNDPSDNGVPTATVKNTTSALIRLSGH